MTSDDVAWRRSTFSGSGGTGGGNCVEAARLTDDHYGIRDSKAPGAGMLRLPRTGMTALLSAITA